MKKTRTRSLWWRITRHGLIGRIVRYVSRDVWHVDLRQTNWLVGVWTRFLRVILIAIQGFHRDRCLEKAAALTYMTIFALPAVLALGFSMAKGLGAYKRLYDGTIVPFLDRAFPAEEGEGSTRIRELFESIFAYVESANLGVLTTVGVVFLVYGSIKMLSSVERALNEIWGVQRARTWVRRFSDYLAIVIISPLVLIVGTGFTTILQTQDFQVSERWGINFSPLAAIIPIASLCLGMGFILLTLPNTRVKVIPAVIGGLVAGFLWQLAQYAFIKFQIGLVRLDAIFSSFAAVPLLLSWIYASWVSLFVGAELSFASQNESVVTSVARTGVVDQSFKEQLAPRLAGRITAAFLEGREPPDAAHLATELGVGPRAVLEVLEVLVLHRLLAQTSEDTEEGYLPARDPDTITVLDLLQALRHEEGADPIPTHNRLDERVDRILAGFDEALRESLLNHTLRELAQTLADQGEARSEPRGEGAARVVEHPSA